MVERVPPAEVPREFFVLQAAAHAAGVLMLFVDMADAVLEDGEIRHPALPVINDSSPPMPRRRWTPSPWASGEFEDCVGLARFGAVLWDLRASLDRAEQWPDVPPWVGLLHELAHAATGVDGYLGGEDQAVTWEWTFADRVFGDRDVVRRIDVLRWAQASGYGADDVAAGLRVMPGQMRERLDGSIQAARTMLELLEVEATCRT